MAALGRIVFPLIREETCNEVNDRPFGRVRPFAACALMGVGFTAKGWDLVPRNSPLADTKTKCVSSPPEGFPKQLWAVHEGFAVLLDLVFLEVLNNCIIPLLGIHL